MLGTVLIEQKRMEKRMLVSKYSGFMDTLLHLKHEEGLRGHLYGKRNSKNKIKISNINKERGKALQEILTLSEKPLLKNYLNQISKAKQKLQETRRRRKDCFCPKGQKDHKNLHRR